MKNFLFLKSSKSQQNRSGAKAGRSGRAQESSPYLMERKDDTPSRAVGRPAHQGKEPPNTFRLPLTGEYASATCSRARKSKIPETSKKKRKGRKFGEFGFMRGQNET